MTVRDWQPPTSLLARGQRLAERAHRAIDLARRAPHPEEIIAHCRQAAVFMEELADLIRKYGSPSANA